MIGFKASRRASGIAFVYTGGMNLYRIHNVYCPLDHDERYLRERAAKELGVRPGHLASFGVERRSIDARDKRAAKRSPDGHQLTCSDIETPSGGGRVDMVDLDEALTELSKLDERQYRLVELRFFAGMTIEEAAQAMNVSQSTIEREWRMARAWLGARLRDGYEL